MADYSFKEGSFVFTGYQSSGLYQYLGIEFTDLKFKHIAGSRTMRERDKTASRISVTKFSNDKHGWVIVPPTEHLYKVSFESSPSHLKSFIVEKKLPALIAKNDIFICKLVSLSQIICHIGATCPGLTFTVSELS